MVDVYVGPDGVLTGTARVAQEAREREATLSRKQSTERRRREVDRKRATVERQIAELRATLEVEETEIATLIEQEEARETAHGSERVEMASIRGLRS